jgi:hypothetical protein
MPMSWSYRGNVLVLRASGVSDVGDLERTFSEASLDPRFARRPALLVNGQDSQTPLSGADVQARVEFFRSLTARGIAPRFAFVLRDGPLLAAGRVAAQAERRPDDVAVALFADEDEALAWLVGGAKT